MKKGTVVIINALKDNEDLRLLSARLRNVAIGLEHTEPDKFNEIHAVAELLYNLTIAK